MRVLIAMLCALCISSNHLEAATLNHSDLQISGSVPWTSESTSFLDYTPANTLSIYRSSGGLFKIESASLRGSLREIIKSGSSQNPLLSVSDPFNDINVINDFFNWQREGVIEFGFFRIEGFRAGKLVQSLSFNSVSSDMVFANFPYVDRLDIRIAVPENFIYHSVFGGRGQYLQPNSYSCYYGCLASLTVEALNIAPIPIPASATMLLSALGGFGGLSIFRRRKKYLIS